MSRKGLRSIYIAVIIGMLIGGLIRFEDYLAGQLMGLLADEVKSSIPCELKYDSASISLIRLTGKGSNARVICNGEVYLQFKEIQADFSLSRIFDHIFELTELRLINGHSRGVGPDSPTYQFIDYLSAPIPPEHDTPGRWKLELERLTVTNSTFVEDLGTNLLSGSGVKLELHYNENRDAILTPEIASLEYIIRGKHPRTMPLGRATSEINISDSKTTFKNLNLGLQSNVTTGEADAFRTKHNILAGEATHKAALSYVGLPDWLIGTLIGKSAVKGVLSSPILEGTFTNEKTLPTKVSPGNFDVVTFEDLSAQFLVDFNHREPIVKITQLKGSSPDAALSSQTGITINNDTVSGGLDLSSRSVTVGPVEFAGIKSHIELSGTLGDVQTHSTGTVDEIKTLGAVIRTTTFDARSQGDDVTFTSRHNAPLGGTLTAEGVINLSGSAPVMKQVNYKVSDFPYVSLYSYPLSEYGHGVVILNGEGIVKGPFNPAEVQTKANLKVTSAVLPVPVHDNAGIFEVSKGKLSLNFGKQSFFKLALGLTEQDTKGTVSITPPADSSIDQITQLGCSTLTSELQYSFERSNPWGGTGAMHLKKFQAGCSPDSLILPQATQVPIVNGALNFKNVAINGNGSNLKINGSIGVLQGWDLNTAGTLHLETFEDAFPTVDQLTGTASISLKTTGKITTPAMQGLVQLQGSSIGIESANIDIQNVSGYFDFNGDAFNARDIQGTINGGKLNLSGTIYPFNMSQTSIVTKIEGATFSPLSNVALLVSGELGFSNNSKDAALISGKISIENAEFEKRIDLITIARSITDLLFSRQKSSEARSNSLPNINLQVDVQATRNIFVVTNFFGSELKSNLHINGTIASPQVTGTMESLSGWFGLKDHRFDISSGVISFNGSLTEPSLALIGESVVRSRTGDTINVYLEAKGPITDPKVSFSSDSSLSQREILSLITSGSQTTEQTLVNSIGRNVELTGYSPLEDIPILNYSRFLKNLTHIDSLSVEPQYNLSTGIIEPYVSARKKLTDLLSVVGETYLGSQSAETRIGVVYNLLPNFNLAAYLANSMANNNLAFEWDATLTVLASQKRFVTFKLEGNNTFSRNNILKVLKLSSNSRILPDDMLGIRQTIKKYYRSRGYFDTRVQSWCRKGYEYCRYVRLQITEGAQSHINEVRFTSNDSIPEKLIPSSSVGSEATSAILKNTHDAILRWARSEGFISARVSCTYEPASEQNRRDLIVHTELGKPVTFIFTGNREFSTEEFLQSINLFGRKVPFGNNTINILMRNIGQMYREKGFLDIALNKEESTDSASGRITYTVSITEGSRVKVNEVRLNSLGDIAEGQLKDLIQKDDITFYRTLFFVDYAVDETMESNQGRIVKVLKAQGFPDAAVTHELIRNADGSVTIVYNISEGKEEPYYTLSVSGLPTVNDPLPDIPKNKVKLSVINSYIDQLLTALGEAGYRAPKIETKKNTDIFEIFITPQRITTVRAIAFEGLQEVALDAVQDLVHLQYGDPINSRELGEIRQKLLNRALFSRVEIIEKDTPDPDVKDLLFRVTEKPLTTLDVGGGFNSEFGVHVFGEGTDRSLFGDGKALILRLDAYIHSSSGETISKGIASLKYSDPSIIGSKYTLTEDLRFQKFNTSTFEFDLERSAFVSSLYRAWNNGVTFSFGHTISAETLNNVSPDVVLSKYDTGSLFLGFLSQTLQYDHRDNPLNPYRGYTLSVENKFASQFFGSEASFDEMSAHISYLYPFFLGDNQFVFAQSARAGTGWIFGNTDYIPISQRYYLGGRNSVRGYKENALGPRGAQGGVIGGDSSLQNTFEFQYRPNDYASINLFIDAGNVYLKNFDAPTHGVPSDIIAEDDAFLRYSTGLGLRYLSPIGPIGLDLGFPLNKRQTDDSWRVHFNIGTNF